MPALDGLATLERLRSGWPSLPVVMMSGQATLTDAAQATQLGAFHFIEKPLSPESVLLTLKRALELRRARDLSRPLVTELGAGEGLIGSSEAVREGRALTDPVAPT